MTMISAIGLGLSEYSQIPDGPHACMGGPVLHLLSLYSPALEPCRHQDVVDSLQNAVPLWCPTNRLTTNQQELSPRTSMDLSRFCAAPLITYCAAKGMNHGHRQDG